MYFGWLYFDNLISSFVTGTLLVGLLIMKETMRLHFHFSLSCIGEGNGNPLQCSCLENPRDEGGWWAAIYGVAQSRIWLKRLSSSSSSMRMWDRRYIGNLCALLCEWKILLKKIVLIKSEWEKRKGKQMRSSEGCSSPPSAWDLLRNR